MASGGKIFLGSFLSFLSQGRIERVWNPLCHMNRVSKSFFFVLSDVVFVVPFYWKIFCVFPVFFQLISSPTSRTIYRFVLFLFLKDIYLTNKIFSFHIPPGKKNNFRIFNLFILKRNIFHIKVKWQIPDVCSVLYSRPSFEF